jgi:hypothetical protein
VLAACLLPTLVLLTTLGLLPALPLLTALIVLATLLVLVRHYFLVLADSPDEWKACQHPRRSNLIPGAQQYGAVRTFLASDLLHRIKGADGDSPPALPGTSPNGTRRGF